MHVSELVLTCLLGKLQAFRHGKVTFRRIQKLRTYSSILNCKAMATLPLKINCHMYRVELNREIEENHWSIIYCTMTSAKMTLNTY